MSLHFHTLTIRDIRRETDQCVSIAFDIPKWLESVFTYKAGQNITIRKNIDGEELRRSYSVCSSPLEGELRVAVKAVEGGKFSYYANHELRIGDTIDVLPPTGKFHTALDPQTSRNYLAFAAGSGITPILSLIKTILGTEKQSRFTLVYGNRNRASIIFREEIEALKNRFIDRFRVVHVLSREQTDLDLQQGHIDPEKCRKLSEKWVDFSNLDHIFICGPEAMIFGLKDYLQSEGIAAEKIHFELFNTPGQSASRSQPVNTVVEGPMANVQLKLDGISIRFPLAFNGESILDAALRTGADLPYACKGGVCATCRAKLVSGEVKMDLNYALEPEESAAGFILTCQSHPRTTEIFVDFDQR